MSSLDTNNLIHSSIAIGCGLGGVVICIRKTNKWELESEIYFFISSFWALILTRFRKLDVHWWPGRKGGGEGGGEQRAWWIIAELLHGKLLMNYCCELLMNYCWITAWWIIDELLDGKLLMNYCSKLLMNYYSTIVWVVDELLVNYWWIIGVSSLWIIKSELLAHLHGNFSH